MKFLLLFVILFSATTQAEISYPVDVENTRWSFYSTNSNKIVRHNIKWPVADGSQLVGASPNVVPLLEVQVPQPSYDKATEKVVRTEPVTNVANNTHTHGWSVVPLTQEELDELAAQSNIQNIVDNLGVGSTPTRLNRVEDALRYLLNSDQ